jgi:hypothetical protein
MNALYNLALIYDDGRLPDIPSDIEKAIHYYEQSANVGNEYAMFNLGLIYQEGRPGHLQVDLKRAMHLT